MYRQQSFTRPDLQAHIHSEALLHNFRSLKSLCREETKFCAVVKANAYGHGIREIVNILKEEADFFAVASFYEAVHIAEMTDPERIFILEPINCNHPPDQITTCAKLGIHCVAASLEAIRHINHVLAGTEHVLPLHINIESGMGRCGLAPKQAQEIIKLIDRSKHIRLAGVYTHFATADEGDLSYSYQQLSTFNDFLALTNLEQRDDVMIHAANSAATIKMPESHFNLVRCGISLYGFYSRPMVHPPIQLRPVLKLQAPVSQIKSIPKGCSVSYGRSYITHRDTKAAIIPLGYADGYWRCFSNKAKMRIDDVYVPVIGRVCMDQLIIDVTEIDDVSIGQMVTIIEDKHDSPCGVYHLAQLADTICYEILTCVHAHVNRIVH